MFSNLPLELGVIARSRNQCDTAGIDYSVPAGEFLKKFGKDIESMIKYYKVLESTTNFYSQWIPASCSDEAIKLAHTKEYIKNWDEHGEQIESTRVENKPLTKEEYLKIKCNDHWYTSEEDLAIHGDCPYHDLKFLLMKKKLKRI